MSRRLAFSLLWAMALGGCATSGRGAQGDRVLAGKIGVTSPFSRSFRPAGGDGMGALVFGSPTLRAELRILDLPIPMEQAPEEDTLIRIMETHLKCSREVEHAAETNGTVLFWRPHEHVGAFEIVSTFTGNETAKARTPTVSRVMYIFTKCGTRAVTLRREGQVSAAFLEAWQDITEGVCVDNASRFIPDDSAPACPPGNMPPLDLLRRAPSPSSSPG